MFDPVTALASFAPLLVKAGDALVRRYLVPANIKPSSVAEAVALAQVENERLRIIHEADKGGEAWRWVESVRKLQRPLVVSVLLGAFVSDPANEAYAALFGVAMFYLFGERSVMYFGVKK